MIDFLSSFGFSPFQWALVMFAAALIGASKTGLVSISLISIPVFAAVFGGRASTGIILPMLVIADIIAVVSYRKSIRWRELAGLMPWALGGIGIALFVGNVVPDEIFKIIIAAAVLLVLVFLIIKEVTGRDLTLKSCWYTSAIIGLIGGFSTMIGNAAGPVISVYFLSLKLDKIEFISTMAWFFWLINIIKIPLHLFFWKTITLESICFDLMMLPAIVLGGLGGFLLIKLIPEKPYRILVIVATFVSSIFLIV